MRDLTIPRDLTGARYAVREPLGPVPDPVERTLARARAEYRPAADPSMIEVLDIAPDGEGHVTATWYPIGRTLGDVHAWLGV